MKKLGLATIVFALMSSVPAFAGSTLDEVKTNGLTVTSASVTYTVTLSDDGSYTTDVGIEGTWEQDGDDLCFTRTTGESNCQELPEGKVSGDSWDAENAAGEAVTVSIN